MATLNHSLLTRTSFYTLAALKSRIGKILFCLFFTVVIISEMAAVCGAENLLKNAGFETGLGWPWWNNGVSGYAIDSETSFSGNNSLSITITDSVVKVFVAQTVATVPSGTYDFGGWVKTDSVTGHGPYLCIDWYNASGGWLKSDCSTKAVLGTTDSWEYISRSGIVPHPSAVKAAVCLCFGEGSTGTVWFDDVSIERIIAPLVQSNLLKPNYRNMVFPDSPLPQIEVAVDLCPDDHGLTLDALEVEASLKNAQGVVIAQETQSSPASNTFNMALGFDPDTPYGDYELYITVYEVDNLTPRAEDIHEIRIFSPASTAGLVSYIDHEKRFVLNGEPFFPIGLYVSQCPNQNGHFSQIDVIADSPFDTLMNYTTHTCSEPDDITDQEITQYLDALNERDLKLIFTLREYIGEDHIDLDKITSRVNSYKTHPAVISWYLNDELDPSHLSSLETAYEEITTLDDSHPIWSVHWSTDWLVQEAHTTDIVGVDPYPIDHLPITHVSQMADRTMPAKKPLWLVPQLFDWSDYPKDPRSATGRYPTYDELRAMTYLAVNHGAKGLVYYSYFNLLDNQFASEPTVPQWDYIKAVASEIRSLRHVFLSDIETDSDMINCSAGDIDLNVMKDGDTYYLFSVNTKEESLADVEFTLGTEKIPCSIFVDFENDRQIGVNGGVFTDSFYPYEVHVYTWQDRCCSGDFNCNGDINAVDLDVMVNNFHCAIPDGETSTPCQGDMNGDGNVDGLDLAMFAEWFETNSL